MTADICFIAGYGGALSVYFGLSVGLRLLSVSFFNIAIQNNMFSSCVVSIDALGGNAYGGGVSLYIGGYSSVFSLIGDAVAAVGVTWVRNVSVTLEAARFDSCSAVRNSRLDVQGANVYGGSFSFYIGAYTWSSSAFRGGNSRSMCGSTNVSGVSVRVQNTSSFDSRASTTTTSFSDGANSYGGSMSVLYVGAYSWSYSDAVSSSSSSRCEATSASGVSILVSESTFSSCSASSSSGRGSYGANSYGGSMSVLYVGAYSWSFSNREFSSSSSRCGETSASGVSVQVSDLACRNCSASSMGGRRSFGVNSYGGSTSVLHVGAYSWSFSNAASSSSSSSCEATTASGVSVQVSDSAFSNCSALSIVESEISYAVNSYGGSTSVLYVGAYSWSFSNAASSSSSSRCEATTASGVSVQVNNSVCRNCSASSINRGASTFGGNSYGGSMSVLYVGAYAWSFSNAAPSIGITSSSCEATQASGVSVQVSESVCWNCTASSINRGASTFGVNSYGGSMSVLYVGAYSWSFSSSSSSSSRCGETSASGVSVQVSDLAFSNCSALSISGGNSFGANSFGGSISVSYIGSLSYSLANVGDSLSSSRSIVEATRVHDISIVIKKAANADTEALSCEYFCIHRIYFSWILTK